MTAVHWCAYHGRPKHIDKLLTSGADPMLVNADGLTALHWAAGALPSSGSENGPTNDGSCARVLLKVAPELINLRDGQQRTALHRAVAEQVPKVVLALSKGKDCDLDVPDASSRTPLQWACALGYDDVTKVLLRAGADDANVDEFGATALHYAVQKSNIGCAKALLAGKKGSIVADNDGRTPLIWAAMNGDAASCSLLASRDCLRHQDCDGRTALHCAAYAGAGAATRILLKQAKKDDSTKACEPLTVDIVDSAKRSAIFGSIEGKHEDVLALLLAAHASVSIVDVEERTPLHCTEFNFSVSSFD